MPTLKGKDKNFFIRQQRCKIEKYDNNLNQHGEYEGDVGENEGDVGQYTGDAGEYPGDVGQNTGVAGEYEGDVCR
uniref:Uncharacterized protein n=1 Tax=Panagrolaimus davidi TaxID=227884 RepID=A0A914PIT3_9BILA